MTPDQCVGINEKTIIGRLPDGFFIVAKIYSIHMGAEGGRHALKWGKGGGKSSRSTRSFFEE